VCREAQGAVFYNPNKERLSMVIAITAAELYTAGERVQLPLVLVEDGRIISIASQWAMEIPTGASLAAFPDAVLVPGFVDIHIHGSAGYDVMEADDRGLERMAGFLAKRGVSSFLATTVTAGTELLVSAVEKIAGQILRWSKTGAARPIGIHLEGPCISRLRRGVHPASDIQNPTIELFDRLHSAAAGTLRLITLAPELPGAVELIREATHRGVMVAIGHTDGTAEDALAAIAAGATHVTHTFNAMRPLEHRAPGVLGEALNNDGLTAEIIADGVHVDPRVVSIFLRCKGVERAVLVTDAISATGMGDGRYKLGSFEVVVNGLRADSEGHLAGSVLTLDKAVRNAMQFGGWPLADCVRLASANPAAVIGAHTRGTLRPGNHADIAVLSRSGEVIQNFVSGVAAIS
jgi:N-acetylglucosamine-6-phosphate deacetylase